MLKLPMLEVPWIRRRLPSLCSRRNLRQRLRKNPPNLRTRRRNNPPNQADKRLHSLHNPRTILRNPRRNLRNLESLQSP